MKRWWYARARADLSQIRKPGGGGFLGATPEWIDYMASPDFWRKQRRKGLVEVLSEEDENPKLMPRPEAVEFKPTKAQRKRQAEIDLENIEDALGAARDDIKRIKAIKPFDDGEAKALAAEIESLDHRLSVLKKTKARLEKELGAEPPSSGDKE